MNFQEWYSDEIGFTLAEQSHHMNDRTFPLSTSERRLANQMGFHQIEFSLTEHGIAQRRRIKCLLKAGQFVKLLVLQGVFLPVQLILEKCNWEEVAQICIASETSGK